MSTICDVTGITRTTQGVNAIYINFTFKLAGNARFHWEIMKPH